jgi:hypothetical protein
VTEAIADQRTMTGPHVHQTVEGVRSFWRAHAAERGFRRGHLTVRDLTLTDLESPVYISAGRYVADCPNPQCNGAAACWIENPEACCLDCGTLFTPRWPTPAEIGGDLHEAVEVLLQRPWSFWRNFRASHPEETIADLKAQNLVMGDGLPGGASAKGPHPLATTLVRG